MPTRPQPKAAAPALLLPGRTIEPAGKVLGKHRVEIKGRVEKPDLPPPRKTREVPSSRRS